jgi:hypothetical protein
MADTLADLQGLLADIRGWTSVVVGVDGTEHQITGVDIQHDESGAQVKAVLQTSPTETPAPSSLP